MNDRQSEIKKLTTVGKALYGDRFQSDLTRALGLSDSRRMRQWLSGDRPIPIGVWGDLKALLKKRQQTIQSAISLL